MAVCLLDRQTADDEPLRHPPSRFWRAKTVVSTRPTVACPRPPAANRLPRRRRGHPTPRRHTARARGRRNECRRCAHRKNLHRPARRPGRAIVAPARPARAAGAPAIHLTLSPAAGMQVPADNRTDDAGAPRRPGSNHRIGTAAAGAVGARAVVRAERRDALGLRRGNGEHRSRVPRRRCRDRWDRSPGPSCSCFAAVELDCCWVRWSAAGLSGRADARWARKGGTGIATWALGPSTELDQAIASVAAVTAAGAAIICRRERTRARPWRGPR